jgi:hypothetical protein
MKKPPQTSPEDLDFPANWDRLVEDVQPAEELDLPPKPPLDAGPSLISFLAASWAELVVVLVPCAAALGVVRLLGYRTGAPALPWAALLATAWWLTAATVLLVVRRGTPGMLLAGLTFADEVPRMRMPLLLVSVLVLSASAGLLALLGGRRWLPAVVAGTGLTSNDLVDED